MTKKKQPEYVYVQLDDVRAPFAVEEWTDELRPVIRRADGELEELAEWEPVEDQVVSAASTASVATGGAVASASTTKSD